MLRFEWNALRAGDHVRVHDPRTSEMTLTDGVVAAVETHKGANGVGIRIGGSSGQKAVLWPSRLAVHHESPDPTEVCWRCEQLAKRTPPRLD